MAVLAQRNAAPFVVAPACRHSVNCPHGGRLASTCHDPAVQTAAACFDGLLGAHRVLAERKSGRQSLDDWCATAGAGWPPTPS